MSAALKRKMLVAGQDQLADQVHQHIEQADIDADGPLARAGRGEVVGEFGDRGGGGGWGGRSGREGRDRGRARTARGGSRAGRRGLVHPEAIEPRPEGGLVLIGLAPGPRDAIQAPPDHGDDVEEDTRHRDAPMQPALAEVAQQAFGGMRERFEVREIEESAGPLDRVEGPKNTVERRPAIRVPLDRDQVAIELVQVFEAFDQEILDGQIQFAHPCRSSLLRRKGHAGARSDPHPDHRTRSPYRDPKWTEGRGVGPGPGGFGPGCSIGGRSAS